MESINFKPIAKIHNSYKGKFGIPRQSGIIDSLFSKIEFENEFRDRAAVKGLENFSHIWLIWLFSESEKSTSLTVRPPRLGGNERLGVFATRSPFRPNPIGLSCVKIEKIEYISNHPVIIVSGADLADGTPILDIKPYLPYADSVPDAFAGFANEKPEKKLNVIVSSENAEIDEKELETIKDIISLDPRPAYQSDKNREYGFDFGSCNIKFTVNEDNAYITKISKKNAPD